MSKTVGFLFRQAPFSSASPREGLDAALATSALTDDIVIFFMGDGVFHLQGEQAPDLIAMKDHLSMLKLLALYDIESVFALDTAVQARQIDLSASPCGVELLSNTEFTKKLHQCDVLLSF